MAYKRKEEKKARNQQRERGGKLRAVGSRISLSDESEGSINENERSTRKTKKGI